MVLPGPQYGKQIWEPSAYCHSFFILCSPIHATVVDFVFLSFRLSASLACFDLGVARVAPMDSHLALAVSQFALSSIRAYVVLHCKEIAENRG